MKKTAEMNLKSLKKALGMKKHYINNKIYETTLIAPP